jgi:hypothetical protein
MLLMDLISATGIFPFPVSLTLGTTASDDSLPTHVQFGQSPSVKSDEIRRSQLVMYRSKLVCLCLWLSAYSTLDWYL